MVAAIIVARLALPLLIPRYPLVIVGALVLDAVDNSLLDHFTDVDLGPDGPYQSFDKALDIYYLAIAYLSAMRNWTSRAAFAIARALFYYRLVGVLAFELLDSRAMLLLFPNTFEYFFIVYEALRTRFDPARWSPRFWLLTAAFLWIAVKLPQEYWIHVAQLDFTDAVADHPWFGVLCLLGLAVLALLAVVVVRPRLPEPEPAWHFAAAAPPHTERRRARGSDLAEKSLLLGLLAVLFAEILPSVTLSALDVVLGAVALVLANTALAGRGPVPLFAVNLVLIYVGAGVLSSRGDLPLDSALFFAFLTTLIVTLYDRYRPIAEARSALDRDAARPVAR